MLLLPCQGGHQHHPPGPWQSRRRYPPGLCNLVVEVTINLARESGVASLDGASGPQGRVVHSSRTALAAAAQTQRRGRTSQTHIEEFSEMVEVILPSLPATDSK
eukprot:2935408-Amphidinium_carterae.1